MKNLVASFLFLSSLSIATMAEENTKPAALPPVPAVAKPSAQHLALSHDTIHAMQADKSFEGLPAQIKQMAIAMAGVGAADATAEQKAAAGRIENRVSALAEESVKTMAAQMEQIWAEVFTETELQAMKAFFTSPAGGAMLAKRPQLDQRMMPFMQKSRQELMAKIQAIVAEEKPKTEAKAPEAKPEAK